MKLAQRSTLNIQLDIRLITVELVWETGRTFSSTFDLSLMSWDVKPARHSAEHSARHSFLIFFLNVELGCEAG
jgi:hypothetical protein